MAKWQEEDRQLLLASVEELDEYLSSSQLSWPLHGSPIQLTPGTLLLSLKRLACVNQAEFKEQQLKIDEILYKHQIPWQHKVETEIPYRLRIWRNALSDIFDYGKTDQSYKYQVRNRVILNLLFDDIRFVDPVLEKQIDDLDQLLKRITSPGSFIWDPALEYMFNPTTFWFLYIQIGKDIK